MLLAAVLIATTFGMPQAEAAGRTAIVRSVIGDVYIAKAGGSRELRAYEGMTLHERDRIRTESDSAVTVAVADRDDTMTLDANTELYISELNETEGGKKSRLRVWAGQMAVKAQSMFGSSDEMEVETPNATMGVRGTFFVTQFSPEYDDTWISVFSGVVESFRRDAHNREGSPLFPTQEAHYFSFPDEDSPSDVVTMLDLDDFIEKVGEEVIQRLLLNRDEIDQENRDRRDAIIEGLRNHGFILFDGNTGEVSEEELTRLDQNLQVLVDSVINRAVENSRLSEEELQEILEEINQGRVGSPLSIDRERSLEDLQGEQSRRSQEMLERMRERQEELIEERRQQREQMQDQNQQLLDRLQQQRERQQEANRQAEIEESERAKREYTDRLSEMERERFEQRLREREEERQRAEEERAKREERRKQVADTDERSTRAGGTGGSGTGGETPPAPDPDPQPDPEPTPDPEPEPQPDPDPEPEPAQPSVKFSADRIVVTPEGVDVAVQLYNVENISAIQLNVHYPSYLHVHVHRESDALLVGDSNPIIEYREVVAGGELTPDGEKEWIYAMLVDEQLREVAEAGADGVTIATIRFTPEVALLDFEETLTGSIELVGIHLVDAEGNELVPKIDTSDARIEFTVSLDRGKAD